MSEVLDLDALIPEPVTIKFGGQEFQVAPPKTSDVLKLGYLGQKLQTIEDLPDDEVDEVIEALTLHVRKCIPELGDQPLNTAQLLKLVEIIGQMSVPPDAKELEARGIQVDAPKKTE